MAVVAVFNLVNADDNSASKTELPTLGHGSGFLRLRKRWWLPIALGLMVVAQGLSSAWYYATESADDELAIRWHRVWTLNDLEQETRRLVEATDSIEALITAFEASSLRVSYTEWNYDRRNVPPPPMRRWPDRRGVQASMSDEELRALHPGPPITFKIGTFLSYSLSTSVGYDGPSVRRIHASISTL